MIYLEIENIDVLKKITLMGTMLDLSDVWGIFSEHTQNTSNESYR